MSTTIGPFAFATSHLIFIAASLMALLIAWLLGRRTQVALGDAVLRIIAVGLLSARAVFVIKYVDMYVAAPWQIINLRDGGFELWAGVVAGILWSLRETRLLAKLRQQHTQIPRAAFAVIPSALIGAVAIYSAGQWYSAQHAHVGLPAIELVQLQSESASSQPINLADAYLGQPVIINLWASWCPPCVREMPLLEDAATRYPNVHVVAVNQGESSQQVRDFLSSQGLELPHVLLDPNAEFGRAIGSSALPTTLFIDSDGRISYAHIGEFSAATLERAVRQLN